MDRHGITLERHRRRKSAEGSAVRDCQRDRQRAIVNARNLNRVKVGAAAFVNAIAVKIPVIGETIGLAVNDRRERRREIAELHDLARHLDFRRERRRHPSIAADVNDILAVT